MKRFSFAFVLVICTLVGAASAYVNNLEDRDVSRQVTTLTKSCEHGRTVTFTFSGKNCIGDDSKTTTITYTSYTTRQCVCIPEIEIETCSLEEFGTGAEDLKYIFGDSEKAVENVYDESSKTRIERCTIYRRRK